MYVGLFLTTLSTLMYEILLTRIFSVSIVLSFLTQISILFDPRWSVASIYSVVFSYFTRTC